MGAQSFITCDRCGERAENTYAKVREPVGWGTMQLMICEHRPHALAYAKVREPVGWGTMQLMICEHRPHALAGDPDRGLARASMVGDLCPTCLAAVLAVVDPKKTEAA